MPNPGIDILASKSSTKEGTFRNLTELTLLFFTLTYDLIVPDGTSIFISVSGSITLIIPVSASTVEIAITAWPHPVEYPSLCIKTTPKSEPLFSGSTIRAPYMSACPLGSSIIVFLK